MMTLGKGGFRAHSWVMIVLLSLVFAVYYVLDVGTQLPTFNTWAVRKSRHQLDEGQE